MVSLDKLVTMKLSSRTLLATTFLMAALISISTSCNSPQESSDEQVESSEVAVQSQSSGDIESIEPGRMDIEMFDKLLANSENGVLIDLRTPDEIAEGKIPKAIEMDYYGDNFEDDLKKLDRSGEYFIYCRAGGRSGSTLEMMEELGFERVFELEPGYEKWAEHHGVSDGAVEE